MLGWGWGGVVSGRRDIILLCGVGGSENAPAALLASPDSYAMMKLYIEILIQGWERWWLVVALVLTE